MLRAISPTATPEEIAAILAAIGAAIGSSPDEVRDSETRDWVRAARLRARGAASRQGPWWLSGRFPGRPRP